MKVHTTILVLLIASSILSALNMLALEFYLYWQYPWFDLPMHFLGGTVIALFVFAMKDFGLPMPKVLITMTPVLLFVLVIGIVWEVFEVVAQISTREGNYAFDTTLDIIMDLLGGTLGYVIGSRMGQLDTNSSE